MPTCWWRVLPGRAQVFTKLDGARIFIPRLTIPSELCVSNPLFIYSSFTRCFKKLRTYYVPLFCWILENLVSCSVSSSVVHCKPASESFGRFIKMHIRRLCNWSIKLWFLPMGIMYTKCWKIAVSWIKDIATWGLTSNFKVSTLQIKPIALSHLLCPGFRNGSIGHLNPNLGVSHVHSHSPPPSLPIGQTPWILNSYFFSFPLLTSANSLVCAPFSFGPL